MIEHGFVWSGLAWPGLVWTAWLGGESRQNDGVRIKVAGIAVIAAVPAVVLAGVIVAQSFGNTIQSVEQTVNVLERTASARFDLAGASTLALLRIVNGRVERSPGACAEIVRDEMSRAPGQLSGLILLRPDGTVRCSAGLTAPWLASPDHLRWLRQARSAHGLFLATPQFVPGRNPASLVGQPLVAAIAGDGAGDAGPARDLDAEEGRADQGSDTLVAILSAGWLESVLAEPAEFDATTWLIDPAGKIAGISGPAAQSVPVVRTLQRLFGGQRLVLALSAEGTPFAYAADHLPNGWLLIVAYRASRDYASAATTLLERLLALGLLLMMGLAAIVAGAGLTFGEPLRRLTAAVSRWQSGATFEPGALVGAPREVRELARSFKQATTTLREREAELARSQERQDLLVLEIHHRVKNNLQIVASLLNLQASRIRVPEARAEFQAARDRVRALATLHRHLYSDGELHTINMRSFLVELCDQLFQALGETADDRITLSIEAPELRMSSDQAVPLALIVTEAVTNSIKYAFPDQRRGRIAVRLTQAAAGLDLVIEDDGVGIPGTRPDAGTRDGIGRHLIRGFARQLGASLDVEEGPGTRYAIRLQLKPLGMPETPEPLDAG